MAQLVIIIGSIIIFIIAALISVPIFKWNNNRKYKKFQKEAENIGDSLKVNNELTEEKIQEECKEVNNERRKQQDERRTKRENRTKQRDRRIREREQSIETDTERGDSETKTDESIEGQSRIQIPNDSDIGGEEFDFEGDEFNFTEDIESTNPSSDSLPKQEQAESPRDSESGEDPTGTEK